MEEREVRQLQAAGLVVVRVDRETWEALEGTRRHGARFTLNFRHSVARPAKTRSLALIAVGRSHLRIGIVRSRQAISSLDTRVAFDFVDDIEPGSLSRLLRYVETPTLRHAAAQLRAASQEITAVSSQLGQSMIAALAANEANAPVLRRILAWIAGRGRVENAVVMQHDAIKLAVNAFGGDGEAYELAVRGPSAIASIRVLEDAAIEHDARWLPGWTMDDSDLTGRARFRKHDGELEIYTANRRPLEELLGVDLIYLNERRGALVMVQYKMLERDRDLGEGWQVRINWQFQDELDRMRQFDCDLEPEGPYRLHPGAFFVKMMKRHSAASAAGIVISLGHLDHMIGNGGMRGSRGGLRIDHTELDGHYLRSEAFVELVRSGYVGTRGATTRHLQSMIEATLNEGRAVVAAIHHSFR
ncbi:hypothetical protein [Novosphingobium sp. PP1Y]|uniref:hypothetical protein n=1 Tax=Novosphingobium sp. PP1Y TaxID=702113 RepID=UPI00020EE615|nr:hypothetical protein [Novosphingobium sp. PP1Y]CCA89984.1 conserved hypothetical protein [Novosphingobium sp. PP1Y]